MSGAAARTGVLKEKWKKKMVGIIRKWSISKRTVKIAKNGQTRI